MSISVIVIVISLHCSRSAVHHIETIRYGQQDALMSNRNPVLTLLLLNITLRIFSSDLFS